jgi:hypothetical protein
MDKHQEKFLREKIEELKNDLKELEEYILQDRMENEGKEIDKKWSQVIEEHRKPLKLIILAEAPLSFKKYFYNKQFTFLDSLRSFWNLEKNEHLPAKMIEKGVLLLDAYRFPIRSDFYKKDTNNVLFDNDYLSDKLKQLKEKKLIDDKTHLTFRYKGLVKTKNLHQKNALKGLNILKDKEGNTIWLNSSEKPQKLNTEVEKYLNP